MNLALMSHDRRKELMVQFWYRLLRHFFSKHTVCDTNTTGKLVAEATGLPVDPSPCLTSTAGSSRRRPHCLANEIDMVLFTEPQSDDLDDDVRYIRKPVTSITFPRHQCGHR